MSKAKPILLLNGPNLNLLGTREPHIYGSTTLKQVEEMCTERAKALGHEIVCRQSNHEGQLVEWIHEAISGFSGIIMNPAAYTHTSVAIMDALKNVKAPIIEIHISNTHHREEFRHHSYVSFAATATMMGFSMHGYLLAVDAMAEMLKAKK